MESEGRSYACIIGNDENKELEKSLNVNKSIFMLYMYMYLHYSSFSPPPYLSLSLFFFLSSFSPPLSLSLSLSPDSFNVTIQFSCTSSPPVYVTIIFKYKIYHGQNKTNGNITIYAFNNKCKCIYTIKYNLYTYRCDIARKF